MSTLTIKDLSHAEQLDHTAMRAVRGGFNELLRMGPWGYDYLSYTKTVTKTTDIDQANNLMQSNATGNGSAVFGGFIAAANNQQGGNRV